MRSRPTAERQLTNSSQVGGFARPDHHHCAAADHRPGVGGPSPRLNPQLPRTLWMDGLASGEQLNELFDSSGPRLVLFRRADAVEDGVAVGTRERPEHLASTRVGGQRVCQILRHLRIGLPGVCRLPATVFLRPTNLVLPRSVHPTRGSQPLSESDVPLRPGALSTTRREPSPECHLITPCELSVDPAEADGLDQRFVVDERRRMGGALLGQHQPHAC